MYVSCSTCFTLFRLRETWLEGKIKLIEELQSGNSRAYSARPLGFDSNKGDSVRCYENISVSKDWN